MYSVHSQLAPLRSAADKNPPSAISFQTSLFAGSVALSSRIRAGNISSVYGVPPDTLHRRSIRRTVLLLPADGLALSGLLRDLAKRTAIRSRWRADPARQWARRRLHPAIRSRRTWDRWDSWLFRCGWKYARFGVSRGARRRTDAARRGTQSSVDGPSATTDLRQRRCTKQEATQQRDCRADARRGNARHRKLLPRACFFCLLAPIKKRAQRCPFPFAKGLLRLHCARASETSARVS